MPWLSDASNSAAATCTIALDEANATFDLATVATAVECATAISEAERPRALRERLHQVERTMRHLQWRATQLAAGVSNQLVDYITDAYMGLYWYAKLKAKWTAACDFERLNHEAHTEGLKRSGDDKSGMWSYVLGRCYFNGDAVAANASVAFAHHQRAVDAGCDAAMTSIAYCYDTGQGAPKNEALAFQLYVRAGEAGHAQGANNAAIMAATNRGQPPGGEYKRAFEYYARAAYLGHSEGALRLGMAYQHATDGIVECDYDKARELYVRAVALGAEGAAQRLAHLDSLRNVQPQRRADDRDDDSEHDDDDDDDENEANSDESSDDDDE